MLVIACLLQQSDPATSADVVLLQTTGLVSQRCFAGLLQTDVVMQRSWQAR